MDENFALFGLNSPEIVFPKNTFPVRFYETAPSPILRAKRTIWHVSRKNFHEWKLRSLLSKTALKSFFFFFLKNTFLVCFYKTVPFTYFQGQTDYVARFKEKLSRTKISLAIAENGPKIVFPKNTFPVRFYETTTSPIFGAKRTMWSVWGEIVMDEFAHFCLKRPRNRFSEKHVSGLFLGNPLLNYFRGQTDYAARFEAKLSRTKTSLAFA